MILPSGHNDIVGINNASEHAAEAPRMHVEDSRMHEVIGDGINSCLVCFDSTCSGLAGHQRLWQVSASQVTRLGKRHAAAEPVSSEAARNDGQTSESQSMTVRPAQHLGKGIL